MKTYSFTKQRYRDNEKPPRKATVHSFQAQGRPITNEEVMIHSKIVPVSS